MSALLNAASIDPATRKSKRLRETNDAAPSPIPAPSRLRPRSKSRLGVVPIGPNDNSSYAAIYRYKTKDGDLDVVARENVLDFFYPHVIYEKGKDSTKAIERLRQRRDVFLLAFEAVQQLPPTDKWSFYQIAGIHGFPFEPYDGDTKGAWESAEGDKWWGGYCQHGTPCFPTWHRAYVMLLEQSIIRQAKLLAETTFTDAEEKSVVKEIAEALRFPFWDWANHRTRMVGIPDVFTSTEVVLYYNWKSFPRKKIPNPLKSFVVPKNLGRPISSSDVFNPSAKPNYIVPDDGVPFLPLGYPTVRHVNAAYMSQNDKLNGVVMRNANANLVDGVYAMLHHTDYLSFSNHSWSPLTQGKADSEFDGHYSSLELVHDYVHLTCAGSGGTMGYNEIAGFDPIFFFHHCNVDRFAALWQYCYPNAWIDDKLQVVYDGTYTIKPDTPATAEMDLTPFRRSQADNEYVSSNDVRTVDVDCGYTYPEIRDARKKGWAPSQMLLHLLQLYQPPQHYVHTWFLVLEKIIKRAFNCPYSIYVFIDKPDATARTPLSDPHLAGHIDVFARSKNVQCPNCDEHRFMRGSLNLTKTMVQLGITTAPQMSGDEPTIADNPLAHPQAITLVYVGLSGIQLDPSTIGWEGPKRSLIFQEGVKDEDIKQHLMSQVQLSTAKLPQKPVVIYELLT